MFPRFLFPRNVIQFLVNENQFLLPPSSPLVPVSVMGNVQLPEDLAKFWTHKDVKPFMELYNENLLVSRNVSSFGISPLKTDFRLAGSLCLKPNFAQKFIDFRASVCFGTIFA